MEKALGETCHHVDPVSFEQPKLQVDPVLPSDQLQVLPDSTVILASWISD